MQILALLATIPVSPALPLAPQQTINVLPARHPELSILHLPQKMPKTVSVPHQLPMIMDTIVLAPAA